MCRPRPWLWKSLTAGEMEVGEGGKESKDGEQKIKKKKKTEKEEEEDDREMNEVRALLKEQDNQDYADASLDFNFEKFLIERM
jgi:glutathione peroxidase-family protein